MLSERIIYTEEQNEGEKEEGENREKGGRKWCSEIKNRKQ